MASTAAMIEEKRLPSAINDQTKYAVGSTGWRRKVEGPYCRLDPNPDAFELARLALCAVTIVPIRIFLILSFVPTYYIMARLFLALAPDKPWAQAVNIFCIRKASWVLLRLMGFWRIEAKGQQRNSGKRGEPRVFVSNHISYFEILYFLAELGPSFVMKRTCLQVPLIGSIAARILDSVSVDNKGGKAGGSGSQAIAARLARMFGEKALKTGTPSKEDLEGAWERGWRGNPLLLFPEGTTSNGSCLLRFKTGVFAGGLPVYPVTVQYDYCRFSPAFESIYWPVHAFRTLAEPANHLRVEYLPRYCPTPEQRADRELYAKAVQGIFCEALSLPAVETAYAEKTQFHVYLRKYFQAHPWGRAAVLLSAPDRHYALVGDSIVRRCGRSRGDATAVVNEAEGCNGCNGAQEEVVALESPGTEESYTSDTSGAGSLDAGDGASMEGLGVRQRKGGATVERSSLNLP